jgi:hypothetical protein
MLSMVLNTCIDMQLSNYAEFNERVGGNKNSRYMIQLVKILQFLCTVHLGGPPVLWWIFKFSKNSK